MPGLNRLKFAWLLVVVSWLPLWAREGYRQYPFTHLQAVDLVWISVFVVGLSAAVLALLQRPSWPLLARLAALLFLALFLFDIGSHVVARTAAGDPLGDALWMEVYGRWYALSYCLAKADVCFGFIFFDEVFMPLSQVLILAYLGLRPSNSAAQSDAFRSALDAPTPSAPGRER